MDMFVFEVLFFCECCVLFLWNWFWIGFEEVYWLNGYDGFWDGWYC